VKLLTKTADKLVGLVVPKATASASNVLIQCACWGGVKWFRSCEVLPTGQLRCGGCNVKTSTKC
jgi:hypothetical protein